MQTRCVSVVGYLNKEGLQSNFNFVTPVFRDLNGEPADINIQDLQMDTTVTIGNAKLSTLDNSNLRAAQVEYIWVPKSQFSKYGITGFDDKNGVWTIKSGSGRDTTYTVPAAEASILKAGTGIQLYVNGTGKALNLSGEVTDAQIELPTLSNFNFVGYPFPADGDIRDIQMDTTVTIGNAKFSTLDNSNLRAAQVEYIWVPRSQFSKYSIVGRDGDNGTWAIKEGSGRDTTYAEPTGDALILKAGSAIQLYVNGTGKKVYINAPYTLAK